MKRCTLVLLFFLAPLQGLLFNEEGNITPQDQYVIVNRTLKLNCTLNQRYKGNLDSRHMFFMHNDTLVNSKFYEHDSKSNLSLLLTIPQVKLRNAGTYYCCISEHGSCFGKSIITGTEVEVGHLPQKITNFHCESYDFKELYCRWCPEKPDLFTNYTLYWTIDSFVRESMKTHICSHHKLDEPQCDCTLCGYIYHDFCKLQSAGDFKQFVNYTFTLEAANRFGSRNFTYVVRTDFSLVRPSPASDLHVTTVSSSKINVSWSRTGFMDNRFARVHSNVTIQTLDNQTVESIIVNVSNKNSAQFKKLRPYHKYKLLVSYKPDYGGYWSEVTVKEFQMPEDVPAAGPEIAGFRILPNTGGDENFRNVVLYWKPVPPNLRNGIITKYTLWRDGVKVDALPPDFCSVTMDRVPNKMTNFTITSNTQMGASPPSHFVLHENNELPKKPEHVYAEIVEDMSHVVIRWTAPPGPMVDSYTLMWCSEHHDMDCKGELETMTLVNGSQEVSRPYHKKKDLVFGIMANVDNKSSGLSADWICLYYYRGRPVEPVFRLNEGQTNLSIIITKPTCYSVHKAKGYTFQYNISLAECNLPNSQCQEIESTVISSTLSNYTFKDLIPYTKYEVELTAVSHGDSISVQLDRRTLQSEPGDPPQNFSCVKVMHSGAILTWKAPRYPNGKKKKVPTATLR